MATFGYGRVSTTQQDTENQRLELGQAGWQIDYWYADVVSGKVPAVQRKAFSEMLSKIRDGETLVVAKLDRLGRDAIDVLQTGHCCKVSDEAAFCLIQRPYISKTLLT
ncbi:recombinase family protein, partial [Escherichia coli]|uniref:recombinase family protein n=1 Tax=Escherichia coli TaxID=562 RepID=UPI001F4997D4